MPEPWDLCHHNGLTGVAESWMILDPLLNFHPIPCVNLNTKNDLYTWMILMLNAVGLSKIKKFKTAGGRDSTVLPVQKVKHIQI